MDKASELLFLKAAQAERRGLHAEAGAIYRQILGRFPSDARARDRLARLVKAGGHAEAGAPAAMPPQLQSAMAALSELCRKGDLARAAQQADALLAQHPDSLQLLRLAGAIAAQQGRFDQAEAAFARALALDPACARTALSLADALRAQGKLTESAEALRAAIVIDPANAAALHGLGAVLWTLERHDEAIAAFDRTIELAPDHVQALRKRGELLKHGGKLDAAIADFRRALVIEPDNVACLTGLGSVLGELRRNDEAQVVLRRALILDHEYVNTLNTLGNVLQEEAQFDEAAACYDAALAAQPGHGTSQFNKGLLKLLQGDYDQGWALYEHRQKRNQPLTDKLHGVPLWRGQDDVAGKSVLLHFEQGLGDAIQFIRYAGMVRDLGARVTLAMHPNLIPLLGHSVAGITVTDLGAVPQGTDYHCPLLSLPLAFGTRIETVPAPIPYLAAQPQRLEAWAGKIGGHGFRVGICWQCRKPPWDRGRSFPVSLFEGIAQLADVRLISLQKGIGEEQLQSLPQGMRVETLGADFDRPGEAFLDSTAVMAHCDLVITCDTSIAHLAGALGVPAWVMLRHVPDWRWLLGRRDSPWYPGMLLFRQDRPGDWSAPFASAKSELAAMLAAR